MAINHADGTAFTAMFFCPIAAGVGAARAGAGWLALLFLPIGFVVGVLIFRYGRAPIYAITGFGMSRYQRMPGRWMRQAVALPFCLLYVILPFAMVWGAAFGLYFGSMWVVRHVF